MSGDLWPGRALAHTSHREVLAMKTAAELAAQVRRRTANLLLTPVERQRIDEWLALLEGAPEGTVVVDHSTELSTSQGRPPPEERDGEPRVDVVLLRRDLVPPKV